MHKKPVEHSARAAAPPAGGQKVRHPETPQPHPAAGHAPRSRVTRLWLFATEYLLALPLGAAVALVWVNLRPESYFQVAFGLDFFVKDIALVFFFGLITKEVVEATAPGGVLHSWRRVLLPVAGALGATVVSALVFAAVLEQLDQTRLMQGWPAVLAVDVALVYFVARIVFGRHPVIPFLLLVAIAANGFGFLALALVAPLDGLRPGVLLPLMTAALATLVLLRRRRLRSFWPYVLAGGGLSWAALFFGGFHPALALVPVIPFLPHAARDRGFFVDAEPQDRDALNQLELWCRHPAQLALFLFGLVAAGVQVSIIDAGAWGLPLAALAGKPVGLLLGIGAGIALGLHLPDRITVRHLAVIGLLSSVGFTMSLFFATATVGPGPVLSQLKMGALLTLAGGLAAVLAARLLGIGRFGPPVSVKSGHHVPGAGHHLPGHTHAHPHGWQARLMRTVFLLGLLLLALLGWVTAGPRQTSADEAAVQEFERRMAAYVELHRRLEGPLPTLEVSRDLRDVRAAKKALAAEIRKARPRARRGDIFTPAVAEVFRTRIAASLPLEQMAAILAEDDEESPAILPPLRVNAYWPSQMPFNYVPGQVIAALPPLPPELQYRIIGRSLVLWDHHADLIVDFLPGAFPA